MLKKIIFSLFIFIFSFCFSNTPNLTPNDVTSKVNEILKAHFLHKHLNINLIERVLRNFIEELDPSKVYLIESDIQKWLYPSEELKQQFLTNFLNSNFNGFEEIYKVMINAINRRNLLEKEIKFIPLPEKVDSEELKNMSWVNTKNELIARIMKIKAIQIKAAENLKDETKDQFITRINKRRISRENELIANNAEEKQKIILSYVLKATASSLDSHTNYFTPKEAKQFMIQVQQRLFGIGAILKDNLNGFCITRIVEKSPAEKAGLKIDDLIIAVDEIPVIGMELQEGVELIRGKQGSNVKLTILKNKEKQDKFDLNLTREEIVLEETRYEISHEPYGDGVIAHLKLFSFYQDPKSSSAQDLKNAIETMQKQYKLKGVILDLRNNSGGLLPQAVAVSGLFLSKGIVASIKDNSGFIQHLRNTENTITWDGPLVVLINKISASASEIVAQSLQDYGRAIIVGDCKTFGKGSFQTFTLDNLDKTTVNPKGEYKVTRGLYYTVSGKTPQLKGVKPDVTVPGILSKLDIGEEFEKYPLENDEIKSNFEDDLSDVPLIYKKKVNVFYKHNLQKVLTAYTQYLDTLKTNNIQRMNSNKYYQNFLKELDKKNFDSPIVEQFSQNDLQLLETYNIIKDLIFLLDTQQNVACF